MAKYKLNTNEQGLFIAIHLDDQIQPGTFEHTLRHLIEHEIDTSIFDKQYQNDETGAPAYDPKILLKIILFAYSRGITSSRKISRCCEENVAFMALSSNSRPHFTTIADFVSTMDDKAIKLFCEVLLLCDEMGLIGKEMFAIDGCKLPSNAAKEWSGTKADFKKKADKMEKVIEKMVAKHLTDDHKQIPESLQKREDKYITTLRRHINKVRNWLSDNNDKIGKRGTPIKSNIIDNESAKIKTSKGVIQGYNGVTAVDSKNQIIVHAEAFGQASETDLLDPMVKGVQKNFKEIDNREDVFKKTTLTADSGFHTEDNMKMLFTKEINGYVPDTLFRKRNPLFADYERYKKQSNKERAKFEGRRKLFTSRDFIYPEDLSHCICPAGKRLYRSGHNVKVKNYLATKFKGPKSACLKCELRSQCLRNPERTEIRQVAYFHGRTEQGKNTFTEKMKHKIDTTVGRALYGMRLAVAEPPFAHICHIMGLNRFSHRGKRKVNTQWNLFCIVHNMKKIHRYAPGIA